MISKNKIRHYTRKIKNLAYLQLTGFVDFISYYLKICIKNVPDSFYKTDSIVYICDHNWSRVSRMAKWIKRSSPTNISFLCSKSGFNNNVDTNVYDGIYLYRNAWHLKRIVRKLDNANIIQGFGPPNINLAAAIKDNKSIYVQDMQDVMVSYEGLHPLDRGTRSDLPYEKYCLENSNGIIAECLEIQDAFRTYNITPKPKNIFFPLYCDNDNFVDHQKLYNSKEIHLVYAGQVHGSWRIDKKFGVTKFFKLIETLSNQKIHLHLYPSPTNVKADYEEYAEISKNNPYFHFHDTISQENLSVELSQYDFGLLPFFKSQGGSSDTKWKYATTMKLFNYWEASLPIIVSGDLFYQSWFIQRYNAGIVINNVDDLNSLSTIIKDCSYPVLLNSVKAAREITSLKKNIPRLVEFYASL